MTPSLNRGVGGEKSPVIKSSVVGHKGGEKRWVSWAPQNIFFQGGVVLVVFFFPPTELYYRGSLSNIRRDVMYISKLIGGDPNPTKIFVKH